VAGKLAERRFRDAANSFQAGLIDISTNMLPAQMIKRAEMGLAKLKSSAEILAESDGYPQSPVRFLQGATSAGIRRPVHSRKGSSGSPASDGYERR